MAAMESSWLTSSVVRGHHVYKYRTASLLRLPPTLFFSANFLYRVFIPPLHHAPSPRAGLQSALHAHVYTVESGYRRPGFNCVVKQLHFWLFKVDCEFKECDLLVLRIGHTCVIYTLRSNNCELREKSQFAIFKLYN